MWTSPIRHLYMRYYTKIKSFILDLLYPQFCFNCGGEGSYLCQDCQSTLGILNIHQKYQSHPPAEGLNDLYFALPYQDILIKNLIQKFKYQPFVKELSIPLASLIITHFQLLDNKPDFFCPLSPAPKLRAGSNGADYILIPVPLEKKKLKWRGFNQAEEIGKELSKFLKPVRNSGNKENLQKENISNGVKIPLFSDCLVKTRETLPQVELSDEVRKENVKGAFLVKKKELIQNKKILLVDDVYTTGATMEECAKVLKAAGAKEIIGIVVARG